MSRNIKSEATETSFIIICDSADPREPWALWGLNFMGTSSKGITG